MNTKHLKVGIIIPYYNGDEYIRSCLESIKWQNDIDLNVYIINNSDKPTKIHSFQEDNAWIHVHDVKPQIGFAKANNIGSEIAILDGADILISTNQDTVFDKYCVQELLLPFQDDPDIHITAPMNLTHDFESIEGFFVKHYLSQCPEMILDILNGAKKKYYQVSEISGSCFAIRVSTVKKIGFFDPLYFMYHEDTDLCRRVRYTNKKIVFVPSAKVAHEHNNTNADGESRININRWKRISESIFILKGLEESLFINGLKVLRNLLFDYFSLVGMFRIKTILGYLINDVALVSKINKIVSSRNTEKCLKLENDSKNTS